MPAAPHRLLMLLPAASWVAIAICLTIISARTECEEFGCGFECGFFGDGVVFVMALSYGI